MTELRQIYKCNICGNVVEAIHEGSGDLVCCDELMELQQEKFEEEGKEKHIPVIERTSTGVVVTVGQEPHPMGSEHYIEWIEVITEHRTYRKFLEPDQEPSLSFSLEAEHITARAYCSLHGLWTSHPAPESSG